MNEINKENSTWQANYYFRTRLAATRKLKEYESMGIKPSYTCSSARKITLKDYIEFVGQRKAAKEFGCSDAACKSWRYGYRQPTINQAKKIIRATDGRLDYESIYGNISHILDGSR